jgi:hypothetical protein
MKKWTSARAVLFVHGIGDTTAANYLPMEIQLREILGADSGLVTYYGYAYDKYNDLFKDKAQATSTLTKAFKSFAPLEGLAEPAGQAIAEFLLDVLWPIAIQDARLFIQADYIKTLQQIVKDGIDSGYPASQQKISIVCHSLGCFQTYEILHRCAREPLEGLTPATHGVHFENVIFMASPVQLIRTIAGQLPTIPKGLYCLQGKALSAPSQSSTDLNGNSFENYSVRNWISIAGDLDPVGGHWLGKKLESFYMNVLPIGAFQGQQSHIDDESLFNIKTLKDWAKLVANIAQKKAVGSPVNDPHAWTEYINRHSADLKQWLLA